MDSEDIAGLLSARRWEPPVEGAKMDSEAAENGLLSEESDDSPRQAEPRGRVATFAAVAGGCLLLIGLVLQPQGGASPASPAHARPEQQQQARELVQPAEAEEALHGSVEAVYTFGAPGSASRPLENLQREDGCFKGLRSYTEDVLGPATKQVDAAAISNADKHPKISTAVLRWSRDSIYVPCPGEIAWPNDNDGTVFGDWNLHWEEDYIPRLKHITLDGEGSGEQEPFATARLFANLAYKIYDTTEHAKERMAVALPGWKLVGRETRVSGAGSLYDEDPVMLAQESSTLDCVVVFAGTNNLDNELTTSTTGFDTGYCGFDDVHVGYRNELWHITKALWPRFRPKLSKCRKVSCTGHSMGGPLCEIFAACANSGRTEDGDYKQQGWLVGTPEAMEEINDGAAAVLVAGAEKRCQIPPCPHLR